jgi:hypothetical protein
MSGDTTGRKILFPPTRKTTLSYFVIKTDMHKKGKGNAIPVTSHEGP